MPSPTAVLALFKGQLQVTAEPGIFVFGKGGENPTEQLSRTTQNKMKHKYFRMSKSLFSSTPKLLDLFFSTLSFLNFHLFSFSHLEWKKKFNISIFLPKRKVLYICICIYTGFAYLIKTHIPGDFTGGKYNSTAGAAGTKLAVGSSTLHTFCVL